MKLKTRNEVPSYKPRILVVIDEQLKKDFERLSKVENRSMSNMIVCLIQDAVKRGKNEGKI